MCFSQDFFFLLVKTHCVLFADINECVVNNFCHADARCANIPGSFTCTCNAGHTGDGRTSCVGKWVQHSNLSHKQSL